MKILAVCPDYPPGSRVGAWLATHEFLAHMVREGHGVTVLARVGAPVRRSFEYEGVEVRFGGPIDRDASAADVVVSHVGDNGIAARAAGKFDTPDVRMAHGGTISPGLLDGADLIVWNSESFRAGRDGIVCHPPIQPERFRTTPGDAATIVNLSKDKGVMTAWRCAERLPHVPFLGVRGCTGEQHEPRTENFTTTPTTTDMRAIYSRTRTLLMPSLHETWGMVGVEAMCSGIPVLAHPTPGLQESLSDAGTFIDRDDTDGWVEELERLADPAEYAEASQKASARAAELAQDDSLRRFQDALESLLA